MLAGYLNLEATDRAACARDQDPLVGQVAAVAKRPQRGRTCDRERGGGNETDVVRKNGEMIGWNRHTLCPSGLVDQTYNPSADGWTGPISCRLLDHAGDVLPRNPTIRPDSNQPQFASVQRGCANRYQGLVWGRMGLADLDDLQPGRAV
ncbi:hypothetical protein [Mesorhizobium sp. M00.F.Ca.ET.216.01.1.1]|uniref:hypothetical protein n=1 Tax=Mesorhizobium sp. M00.F.Ca.ET.216.01.1.1 TaxID=2500528 RepID=UPI001FDEB4F5|nr:hypothetical protein [Mesorhizobium sp. M00.F.Ca.ET.216.01.1.1]